MAVKDQHLALSSGMGLAGIAVTNFWEYYDSVFNEFKEEIIKAVIKPKKLTAVHHYLNYFPDFDEEIHNLKDALDIPEVFDFIERTLAEVKLTTDLPTPDFSECDDNGGHFDCDCFKIVQQWMKYSSDNNEKIAELVIHSAFQFVFQDRKFLRDFHLELAEFIEYEMDYIKKLYPEYVTKKGRIKRQYFPEWLKSAVFYRDKGTCVICRCDLSNLIRSQNKIHLDHIVPLELYGTNDPSNMQLLCETCNSSKGARSTATSAVNVPCWNLF
ncbi:HNH endonuclease [Salipaludibacillus aurantiacus]|uniref:HNH endonuclease n=1 Tax=Salipaludibacillus aurantiacus TaxID=1601833 RepID=A0A1H9UME9_9BACI|nr:HNH endonuclease signature motif containing protein [Salipaludibacillus aurantiacus]SES10183.1 HNH endonuclease [Salipaludibacillus aurantiacus]